MEYDITTSFNHFRSALSCLWLNYYNNDVCKGEPELLSRLYEMAPDIFIDLVIFTNAELDYRAFTGLNQEGSERFYFSIKIELDIEIRENSLQSWVFSETGDLMKPDEDFFHRKGLYFGGFHCFDSNNICNFIEILDGEGRFPIGIVHESNVIRYLLKGTSNNMVARP
ncbi:MAG: hypothetical protein ACFCU4_08015 [Puniceicoccaceae bacterium]